MKSISLHRPKGMQGPCCSFHLSSALLISLYVLFFSAIPFREHCFISSLMRHFYYLNHAFCGNASGPESLQGVISCLHSCWEKIYHLLKYWEYKLLLFFSAARSTLLVLFIHPDGAAKACWKEAWHLVVFDTPCVLQNQQQGHLPEPLSLHSPYLLIHSWWIIVISEENKKFTQINLLKNSFLKVLNL